MNRRDVLRMLGAGAASGAGLQALPLGLHRRHVVQSFVPDVELELTAAPGEASILPGAPTSVWRFTGSVVKGPPDSLHALPGSYLGPGSACEGQRVGEGMLDAGWQDTVLVLPHETVRIRAHFTTHPGLYLYHCHILEHEDMGMMRNFRVVPA